MNAVPDPVVSNQSTATKVRDFVERVATTYVLAFVTLVLAGGVFDATGVVHLDYAAKLAIAAAPAALDVPLAALRVWNGKPLTFGKDLALRIVVTFVTTFGGLLIATNYFDVDATDRNRVLTACAISALGSALTALKGVLAAKVVPGESASLDPNVTVLPTAA